MDGNQLELIDCIQTHYKTEQDRKTKAEATRNSGIKKAVNNAESKTEDWADKAYRALITFLGFFPDRVFMAEDVRNWAEGKGFPVPPSKRAWGAIFVKASKERVLRFAGYSKTMNPLAHRTPAALWKKGELCQAAV